jgi:hypothetical protein
MGYNYYILLLVSIDWNRNTNSGIIFHYEGDINFLVFVSLMPQYYSFTV